MIGSYFWKGVKVTMPIKVTTTLGTNPRVFQEGPFIFRVSIETEEKHPWTHSVDYFWDNRINDNDMLYLGDIDGNEVLSITGLPIVPESDAGGNWYEALIVPGTRYSLDLLIYTAFPVDEPICE